MSENTNKPVQKPSPPTPEEIPIITLKTVRITDSIDLTKIKNKSK